MNLELVRDALKLALLNSWTRFKNREEFIKEAAMSLSEEQVCPEEGEPGWEAGEGEWMKKLSEVREQMTKDLTEALE